MADQTTVPLETAKRGRPRKEAIPEKEEIKDAEY